MSTKKIICVIGLPGSGKTTFSDMLAEQLTACRINADFVRSNINKDLGFSDADRIEQATRMAHLSNMVLATGKNDCVIVDFVCPTPGTRSAFASTSLYPVDFVWMNTIIPEQSRYANTRAVWVPPTEIALKHIVDGYKSHEALEEIARHLSS